MMKKNCLWLIVLCLVLVSSAEVSAVPVTPGGLVISGQMYWEGDGEPLHWTTIWFLPDSGAGASDPGDRMYADGDSLQGKGEIGVSEGTSSIPFGDYESIACIFLGHTVHALDLTVSSAGTGPWSLSEDLRFEVRDPLTGELAWSLQGPFSAEPAHAYINYLQPTVGYDFRLAVVPDASPLVTLLSGLGVLAYKQRRIRA